MFIRGEYTIYSREIEEALYTNPGVMEAAVIGLPDKNLGELICACVKLKPNYHLDVETLNEYIKSNVSDYKVPDKIIIVDEIPMTASGKIRKISLQQQIQQYFN